MEKKLKNEIISLALPIAFQQFMVAIVSACDAVMLGKLSQSAMSAVSLATQITFIFNLFMAAYVIGENMFVAQYYGKKDYENITGIFQLVLKISCVTAILFGLCTALRPDMLMQFLTNDRELIAQGSRYLRIIGVSYLFSAVVQICMTIMKNCGAVNMSTVINVVGVVVNIILNVLLIFGIAGLPEMGIAGAAFATVLSTIIQALWSAAYIAVKLKPIQLLAVKRKEKMAKPYWEKTAPVLVNELVWGGGFAMYSVIMGHLGVDVVAANGIANIAKNLIVCLCLGLGSAGSIIIGNLLGAELFEEAKSAGKALTKLSVICGMISGLLLLILSPFIIHAVTLTAEAQKYLKGMLFICSYYLIGKSVNSMTIGGIFPAGGDAKFGLLCDAVTMWCITIPLGSLCAFVWKTPVLVVYFVLNLDEIIKLPVVCRHYKKYRWLNNIVNQ